MDLNQLSSQVIKAAITVHQILGPGLLESVYQSCMLIELRDMGMEVQSEVPLPVFLSRSRGKCSGVSVGSPGGKQARCGVKVRGKSAASA